MRRCWMGTVWILLVAPMTWAGTSLWVEPAGVMIMPDRSAGTRGEIRLTGVRNEYVAAQLALRSDEEGGGPCSFEWTALRSASGKEIARQNIALFRMTEKIDALVPLVTSDGTNVANSLRPEKDKTIPFWVDVLIPAGTPAEEFTGRITLKADGRDVAVVPVEVKVLDLEIPAEPTLPTQCQVFIAQTPHLKANIETYMNEIRRHRLQPHCDGFLYSPKRDLEAMNPGGRGWQFLYLYLDGNRKNWPYKWQEFKKGAEFYRNLGMIDRVYVTANDPVGGEVFAEFFKGLIQEVPEFKDRIMAITRWQEGSELSKVVRCFVYDSRTYRSEADYRARWDERRAQGHEVWLMLPAARASGWAAWREKAGGIFSWGIYGGWENRNEEWSPAGLLCPGLFRKQDASTVGGAPSWTLVDDISGPVMKRQAKRFRQGLAEYELLKMAEKKAGRPKVEAIVDTVYTELSKWNADEDAWEKARQQVIDLLLQPDGK